MRRRGWLLLAMVGFMAGAVLAQQVASDAPATREEILKLFDVMQIRQQMEQVMQQVMQQTRTMSHEALKTRHPDISEEELARLDGLSEQSFKDVPIEGMLDDVIPVYQKHLSKADVEAMIGFYSTPTGQKILREMPAMTAEGMQAMYPRIQKQMDEVMRRAEQLEQQEREKKQPAAPKPEPPKD
ncbi:MAG: DUF2059 domain-containing protein [Acidobacteriia bacterium]|nr:DUF2059 domain-containing protein [Terriglobia bacterium]